MIVDKDELQRVCLEVNEVFRKNKLNNMEIKTVMMVLNGTMAVQDWQDAFNTTIKGIGVVGVDLDKFKPDKHDR